MIKCLVLLSIKEMQIKTTRYHFIPTRMAIINKKVNKKIVGKEIEKLNPYILLWGMWNDGASLRNSLAVPQNP